MNEYIKHIANLIIIIFFISQLILSFVGITQTDISELGKAVVNTNPQNGFMWVNRIKKDTLQWTNLTSPCVFFFFF